MNVFSRYIFMDQPSLQETTYCLISISGDKIQLDLALFAGGCLKASGPNPPAYKIILYFCLGLRNYYCTTGVVSPDNWLINVACKWVVKFRIDLGCFSFKFWVLLCVCFCIFLNFFMFFVRFCNTANTCAGDP